MSTRSVFATMSLLATASLAWSAAPSFAQADDVRYYEENGVTYRETRQTVTRPVYETELRTSTQTVYRDEPSCEVRETVRTSWTPVTEYRCEAYWAGRWNPFVDPYLAYRMVPQARWEARTELVQTPVTSHRLVPETRTVQVPVATQRMVTEERITRVAVGRTSPAVLSPTPTPSGQQIGGLAQLDKDPPRQGVSTAWRPSTTTR